MRTVPEKCLAVTGWKPILIWEEGGSGIIQFGRGRGRGRPLGQHLNPSSYTNIAHGTVNPGKWQFWGGYDGI